jgi:hypothetical protein
MASGTLYCDDFKHSLNIISGQIESIFVGINSSNQWDCNRGVSAEQALQDACVNNFCIFAPNNPSVMPIFATSLTRNYTNISKLDTVFATQCNVLDNTPTTSNTFQVCGNTKYKYNNHLKLIVYDPNSVSFIQQVIGSVKRFFTSLFGRIPVKPAYSVISESQLFTRFYYTINPSPSQPIISAFNERRYNGIALEPLDYYVISISTTAPMTVDVCNDIVLTHNLKKNPGLPSDKWITCSNTTTNALIVGDAGPYGNAGGYADELWPKLTGQIRLP